MAYLSPFKNDLFVSYARVDDKSPGRERGWVTFFHEYLEVELAKRFGRMGVVEIWRDRREIGGNTLFDEEIQSSINDSALFLALTSRGYLSEDGYCLKELRWFHQKAAGEPYGLQVGTSSRLFNLLLQNIPHDEWPDELSGMSGLDFHDAQTSRQFGLPSRQDGELFERQMRRLVDEIESTLRAFKEVIEPSPPEEPEEAEEDSFSVFLAHTEGALVTTRKRVIEELRQSGVRVVASVPPPYSAMQHERRVKAEIGKARLSVHLLDGAGGMEVEGDATTSYYRKQVEIGRDHARSQLIWVPKSLDLQTVEDEQHRDFLNRLENGRREQAPYSFIRGTPGSISHEVLAKIEEIKREEESERARREMERTASSPSSALLDTHLKDQLYTLPLSRILYERKMPAYINPGEDEPQKNSTLFQEMLKKVNVLIIVFGEVADAWVRERLNSALQIAIAEKHPLKLCGIYLAPVNGGGAARQVSLGVFPVAVPIFLFDKPETLVDLLDRFVGR